jgi:ApaG protein
MSQDPNSTTTTEGIRIEAAGQFVPEQSDTEMRRFLYVYRIRFTNEGAQAAQLLSRHWIILDAENAREEVIGEGVVGKYPHLSTGESFEYHSYCPLRTEWGTMEGSFTFRKPNGDLFEVVIGRFFLVPSIDNLLVTEA